MQSTICALVIFSSLFAGAIVRADDLDASSTLQLENPARPVARKWTGEWRGKLGGTGVSEGKDEGAAAYFEFDANFDFRLAPWMMAHVSPSVELFSSRLQERYANDEYENRVRLDEGFFRFRPVPQFEARLGAFAQKEFLDLDILISQHRTFPGVQLIGSTETKPVNARLVVQELVPTSYSLNTEREDKEGLPHFRTQSVHVDGKVGDWKALGLLGHYSWTDLPDKVAYQSAMAGNTVLGAEVAPGSKLAYAFDGAFWRAGTIYCPPTLFNFELGVGGERNLKAPTEKADAQYWMVGPIFNLGERSLQFRYFSYFIESDATIGVYTRSSLGYANRVGDWVEAKYDFKDLGWALKARWVNARTVADRSSEDNQKTFSEFYLGVETAYAPF